MRAVQGNSGEMGSKSDSDEQVEEVSLEWTMICRQ